VRRRRVGVRPEERWGQGSRAVEELEDDEDGEQGQHEEERAEGDAVGRRGRHGRRRGGESVRRRAVEPRWRRAGVVVVWVGSGGA